VSNRTARNRFDDGTNTATFPEGWDRQKAIDALERIGLLPVVYEGDDVSNVPPLDNSWLLTLIHFVDTAKIIDTAKKGRADESDARAPMTRQQRNDAIESGYSQRRDADYKAIADAARKAGDQATAGWWDNQRVNCDYALLPPGMSSGRLREIAGLNLADSPSAGGDGNAYLRGVLVQTLLRIIRCVELPALRLDAVDEDASVFEKNFARGLIRAAGGRVGELRIDAAEIAADNKLKDAWDGQWRQPPKSIAMLGQAQEASKVQRSVERRDEAAPAAAPGWGDEWKRSPRSSAYLADVIKEPARCGGLAIADVVEPRLDTSDADEPILELQQRAALVDEAPSSIEER
jgi:hypothetical protein